MEYQKIKKLLDKRPNQTSKFRTKSGVEIWHTSNVWH